MELDTIYIIETCDRIRKIIFQVNRVMQTNAPRYIPTLGASITESFGIIEDRLQNMINDVHT